MSADRKHVCRKHLTQTYKTAAVAAVSIIKVIHNMYHSERAANKQIRIAYFWAILFFRCLFTDFNEIYHELCMDKTVSMR